MVKGGSFRRFGGAVRLREAVEGGWSDFRVEENNRINFSFFRSMVLPSRRRRVTQWGAFSTLDLPL